MNTFYLEEIPLSFNNNRTDSLPSKKVIYEFIRKFALKRCKSSPCWTGHINDLSASSKAFSSLDKNSLAGLIIELNESKQLPEYEFWYQSNTGSLIIFNRSKIAQWRALYNCIREHQTFIKLFSSSVNRKIVSNWYKDKFTIERLFFNGETLGNPTQIQLLNSTENNGDIFNLIFRSGHTLTYVNRSYELEQSFIYLSQLLGFFEISTPLIFTNTKYTWFKVIPHLKPSDLKQNLNLNFIYGLIYSLLYTLDSGCNLLQLVKNTQESPFYDALHVILQGQINKELFHTSQPSVLDEEKVEGFIDGFSCGYRKVLSGKYTITKLTNYSKLIPKKYLLKLTQQLSDSEDFYHSKMDSLVMNEEDLSLQIGLIRQEYCV